MKYKVGDRIIVINHDDNIGLLKKHYNDLFKGYTFKIKEIRIDIKSPDGKRYYVTTKDDGDWYIYCNIMKLVDRKSNLPRWF